MLQLKSISFMYCIKFDLIYLNLPHFQRPSRRFLDTLSFIFIAFDKSCQETPLLLKMSVSFGQNIQDTVLLLYALEQTPFSLKMSVFLLTIF